METERESERERERERERRRENMIIERTFPFITRVIHVQAIAKHLPSVLVL